MNHDLDQQTFTAAVRAVDRYTQAGIPDLRVEAWVRGPCCADIIAAGTTDAAGEVFFDISEDALERLVGSRPTAAWFRVFDSEQLLVDTEGSLTWRVHGADARLCIQVDRELPQGTGSPAPWTVRGVVLDAAGQPCPGVPVSAFDRNVGQEETLLGKSSTDASGRYQIAYQPEELGRPGKMRADLAVRAYDAKGAEIAARFVCRVPPTAIVDLTLDGDTRGLSEIEQLTAAVLPVIGELPLAELTEDDVALAACSARVDLDLLDLLVAAHSLAQGTDIPPYVFYGLLRWGLPKTRAGLFAAGMAVHRQALTWAVEENIIPLMTEAAIEDAVRRLAGLLTGVASDVKTPGAGSLNDVLAIALTADADRQQFLERYVLHEGPIEAFWQSLRDAPGFTNDMIARLQRTIQLGALTRHHLPLMKMLDERFQTSSFQSLRDLAKLDVNDWRQFLESTYGGSTIGAPASVPGATAAERIQSYASVLTGSLETAFPGAALAGRLASPSPALADAVQILGSAPEFDLGSVRVAEYTALHPEVFSGVANQALTIAQLQAMERLHKLTSSASEIKAMMELGFDSAQSIVRLGSARFQELLAGALGEGRAAAIYGAARQVSASSHALAARYHAAFHTLSAYALPKAAAPAGGQVASWPALFGSLDFCACGHCRSVYSPAAYLVDLLQFLRRHSAALQPVVPWIRFNVFSQQGIPWSFSLALALDVLLKRRPDIASIELTCENTNTPVPYVDLVNEILEYAVANTELSPDVSFPDHIATEGTPAELAAQPQPPAPSKQIVVDTAHEILATRPYPWRLPFNLGQEEARVYLDHLGVSRARLMEVLRPGDNPEPADFPLRLALERLRLSEVDRQLLTAAPVGGLWQAWGLAETSNSVPDPTGVAQAPIQGTWIQVLRHVAIFMARSGASYEELAELLGTDFVNPAPRTLVIEAAPGADPLICKLSELRIPALDAAALDRIHRFNRLRRALGWTTAELDQAIRFLGGQTNDALLIKLADVVWLQAELRAPVLEMLAWWGPIQTRSPVASERSLYEQLFLNKAIKNPVDEVFRLNDEGTELSDTTQTIAAHSAAVTAGLRLTERDLGLLIDASASEAELHRAPIVDGALTLGNLTRLFRAASLSRALKLPIRDILAFDALSGLDVLSTQDPAETRRFIEVARDVRASRFGVAQLDYLLRHVAPPSTGVAPDPAAVDAVLADLAAGLEKVVAEPVAPGESGELALEAKLSRLLPPERVARILAVITGTSALTEDEQRQAIDEDLSAFLDSEDARAQLVGPAALQGKDSRIAYVLTPLTAHLRRINAESFVRERLGEALRLDAASIEHLLTSALHAVDDENRRAIADFMGGLDGGVAPSEEQRRRGYLRLEKISSLMRRLKITAEELRLVLAPQQGQAFDLQDLNLSPVSSAPLLFQGWLKLVRLLRLRDALPAGKAALADLFRIADTGTGSDGQPADLLAEIAARTGWPLADLATLAGSGGRFKAAPEQPQPSFADQLLRLSDACAVLKRLGIAAATAAPWADGDTTPAAARATAISIRDAVKARYDDKEWSTVARPLRDVLRERQRAALVDYLAWKRGYTDAKRLFDELLVDIEMSPCQLTSRVKQAIGSVQLFVQRCFLNLEAGVALGEEAAREWKWMKSYRVWEANRKVFLYPENWIEPELRDDKTPFFKALENQLMQGDIDRDSAEEALRGYLEKLDQVARLEVMGMVHEREGSGKNAVDVLHVFARTRAEPRVHFYRRRLGDGTWTPWEKIELDIQSDHLIPVIYERRLMLLWAILEEKPEDDQSQNMGDASTPGRPASSLLEIRLAWSERKHGKWTARRVAETPALRLSTSTIPKVLASRLYFRAYPHTPPFGYEPTMLVVRCLVRSTYNSSGPTMGQSRLFGEFILSGCRGRWRLNDRSGQYIYFYHRQPGMAAQDRMAIVESTSSKSDGHLHLLAGKLVPGDQKQLAEGGEQLDVLRSTPGQYRILFPNAYEDFLDQGAFVYEDNNRSFFVTPRTETTIEWTQASKASIDILVPVWAGAGVSSLVAPLLDGAVGGAGDGRTLEPMVGGLPLDVYEWASWTPETIFIPHTYVHHRWRFEPFYHPYTCNFIGQLNRRGVDGLLDWSSQSPPLQLALRDHFAQIYQPTDAVALPYPVEDVDFSPGGAYSAYNWELFFHAPLLIADRLSKNLRFEEAQRWFHAIFDPTTGSTEPVPQRFWKVRPFHENADLAAIDELLAGQGNALSQQIEAWRRNPFNPHLIARLRPLAYQKTVVMKYIDNLIGWGDQLFRRDTIESINEATQLYLLAAEILGPRPQAIPPRAAVAPRTYRELEPLLDDFSNALVQIESWAPSGEGGAGFGSDEEVEPLLIPSVLYFCVPPNDKLLGYWDTVADRLFKIRHCMNIEGVVRQLPLFEPPIDPALLVRAAAAGVDLSTVLQDLAVPAPHHRFQVLLQKANELCAEVKALGQALLSAREKRDAEALALLRGSHELQLLDAVRRVKERQVAEAQESLAALQKAREMASLRHQFYRDVPYLNASETAHLALSRAATVSQAVIEGIMAGAAASYAIPATTIGAAGWAGSAVAVNTPVDGARIGAGVEAGAKAASIAVSLMREGAAASATMGGYQRRWDEWKREEKVAAREVEQIDKQIAAAEVRVAIAERDLENHDLQAEQAREVDAFMREKFTAQELYDWMSAQTSAIYFQAYQLAHDVAKRAEKAYRFERGVSSSSYVQFGHWDSLRKGLLAGERLSLDLKRLELAYMEQDRRELELTKSVSIALHDPAALMELKANGACDIDLPEALFDMDFPGHYMRRIKNVSLTLPCIVGPYDSVNCTLTLLSSEVRVSSISTTYADPAEKVQGFTPTQSIATSQGQADSGMFEVSFRDERYLPFEGAGAISTWRLELPADTQAFDVDSLQDVVMHLRYTARDGGELLREAAETARDEWLAGATGPLSRMLSLRQELPAAWQSFIDPAGSLSLDIPVGSEGLPLPLRSKDLRIHGVELYLKLKPGISPSFSVQLPLLGSDPAAVLQLGFCSSGATYGSGACSAAIPSTWVLSAQALEPSSVAEELDDIIVIFHSSAS